MCVVKPLMFRRHKGIIALLLVGLAIALMASVPWSKKVPFRGGYARITKAPFVRSLFPEAYSTITYYPDHGQVGTLVLWQDVFDGPVMVMPANDTNAFLCLYDYDTCFRLFRIHTDRVFKPLASGSDINRILFTCTWEIEDGSTSWDEMLDYLRRVSPAEFGRQSVSVGLRGHYSPSELVAALTRPGAKYPTPAQ